MPKAARPSFMTDCCIPTPMGLKLSRDGDDPKEATEGWNLSTAEETTGAALPDEVPSATMRVLAMAGGFLSSSASSDLLMAVLRAGGTFVGLGCLCESAALLVGAGFFLSSSSPFLLAGLRAVVMARSGFQRWKKVRQLFFFSNVVRLSRVCFTSRSFMFVSYGTVV